MNIKMLFIISGLASGMLTGHMQAMENENAAGINGSFVWNASQGNFRWVKEIVNGGYVDINFKNKDGVSALHWVASRASDTEDGVYFRKMIVYLLQQPGIDKNIRDNQGRTPLHWAAKHGNYGAVKALVLYKADVNAQDNTGATPLHAAAYKGHNGIVDLLISEGHAKLYCQDKSGATPLSRAAHNGMAETVKLLLTKYNWDKENPLLPDHGFLLIDDNNYMNALHHASTPEVAQVLLDAGFPKDIIDKEGRTAYTVAMENRYYAVAKLLK